MTTISKNLLLVAIMAQSVAAFVPAKPSMIQQQSNLRMMDPSLLDSLTTANPSMMVDTVASSTNLLSFTDQGQNLAGIFFQASLLPYLLFLYFLSFKANRISDLGNFGFQFVLLFVMSTIPSGIISKSVYGISLANDDWLHGGAETLLTVANILIVRKEMQWHNPCLIVLLLSW